MGSFCCWIWKGTRFTVGRCSTPPYLLPNGNLFYLAKAPDDGVERFPAFQNFNGGLLLEADWDSNIVWQHEDPNHHHDARRTDSGGAIYLTVETMPADLAVRGSGRYGLVVKQQFRLGKAIVRKHNLRQMGES